MKTNVEVHTLFLKCGYHIVTERCIQSGWFLRNPLALEQVMIGAGGIAVAMQSNTVVHLRNPSLLARVLNRAHVLQDAYAYYLKTEEPHRIISLRTLRSPFYRQREEKTLTVYDRDDRLVMRSWGCSQKPDSDNWDREITTWYHPDGSVRVKSERVGASHYTEPPVVAQCFTREF